MIIPDGIRIALSPQDAELKLLSLANEKDKFGLAIGTIPDAQMQQAFERGIDNGWYTLVDVTPIAAAPPNLIFRIFKLTPAGIVRRDELRQAKAGASS